VAYAIGDFLAEALGAIDHAVIVSWAARRIPANASVRLDPRLTTSGHASERFALVIAIARNRSLRTCGAALSELDIMNCVRPPIVSVNAGPVPS
jgi:hypothetical protein